MFLLLVGLYTSNGDRIGTQNLELSNSFRLNFPKNVPKRLPAGILQKVTGIVFAEAETADQISGTYSHTEKRCGSLWI